MIKIPYYQIDAFTSQLFSGNPAAVCLLDNWLPDEIMQSIAYENNLSETAFVVGKDAYHIRWFTPTYEVPLCGHGTLAACYVIFHEIDQSEKITLQSHSGSLTATRDEKYIVLNFPIEKYQQVTPPQALLDTLSIQPIEVYQYYRYMCIFEHEADIRNMKLDRQAAEKLAINKIIVTAPGDHVDFVSRFFIPCDKRFEDPVTGSAHCALVPYWSNKMHKTQFVAQQLSSRGGEIRCELKSSRVELAGQAVLYSKGMIYL